MLDRLTIREEPQDARRDLIFRTLHVRAATINEEQRSVEVTMTTEGQVTVFDWNRWEPIDEVLIADGGEFDQQLPLLKDHQRGIDNVLGSVRDIRREGTTWVGRAMFLKDDKDAERAWNKVKQGAVTDVSIGYRATEFEDIPPNTKRNVGGREYTATSRTLRISRKWEPRELSLVPIGADRATKVREHTAGTPRVETLMNPRLRKHLESLGLRSDASEQDAQKFLEGLTPAQRAAADKAAAEPVTPPAAPPPAAPAVDPAAIRAEAQRVERERVQAIHDLAGRDIPAELVQQAIKEGWDTGRASAEFLRHYRGQASKPVPSDTSVNVGNDKMLEFESRAMGLGLAMRSNVKPDALIRQHATDEQSRKAWEDASRAAGRYAHISLLDVCRKAVALMGGRYNLEDAPEQTIRAALSGGTLSGIFTTSAYATLLAEFMEQPDTTAGWVQEQDVANFLTQTEVDFTAATGMKKLGRGGTAEHASVADASTTYKLARYAKMFSVDEQDIIDDRFQVLTQAPRELAKGCARLRPELVYSTLVANATMGDTGALFNGTALTTAGGHANLGSTALGTTGLKTAIQLMGKQYLIEGKKKVILNLTPRYLIVPQALGFTAMELMQSSAIVIAGTAGAVTERGNANVLANVCQVVVDERVGATGVWDPVAETHRAGSDTAYYLAAAPGGGISVSYRRGTGRAPQMRSKVLDGGQWGLAWDVNFDIEAHVSDFRGLVKGNS